MIAADGRTVWLRDVITIRSRDDVVVMRGVMVDVTDRRAVEDELRVANERLRTISNRIELAREEEGARIARELHDELGSALTSLNWELEDLDRLVAGVGEQRGLELHERVAIMAKQVAGMIAAVRRVAAELRPSILDDLGLVAALSYQAQQFEHRYRIVCRFDASVDDLDISPAAKAAVFRIVQEALTNVARHASATDVRITAEEDEDGAVVEVRDNGRGISESEAAGSRTCGLLGMRERAELVGGRITIGGTPGRGTVVQVRVPYIRRARE
jgi:signal transduction histidine kinase